MDTILTNDSRCRIVVDAMGGDFSPLNAILGSVEAFEESDFQLLFVGDKNKIEKVLKENNRSFNSADIIHTTEVISMSEHPTEAFKNKKNSSIVVGANLVKGKKADAFVSAGNTGAVSVASIFDIGRIEGVKRPTLTAPLPNEKDGFTFVSDVGAFVDSRPEHLFDYAVLSSIYIEEIYGIKRPKIGLLNVGEEEEKGYKLTTETAKLLNNSDMNFYGNVEGKDILKGTVDLIICDGFVGNILLKFAESMIPFLKSAFSNFAGKSFINKLKIAPLKFPPLKNAFKSSLQKSNPDNVGGLPLLGIDGISIIGHGSSSKLAFKNMVLRANEMHRKNLIEKLRKSINQYSKLN